MSDTLCRCKAYPFPHRMGGGRCNNKSTEGPICGYCGCSCDYGSADVGHGQYEFWGSVGYDSSIQLVSVCCEATLYTDQTLTKEFIDD